MDEVFDFIARPKAVWFTTNRSCDARCPHCYAKGTRYNPSDDMTLETAKSLLKLVSSMGIKLVTVLGGEPLLWEPLLEFNHIAKGYGIIVRMATNAIRFSDDDFWQKYLEQPCDTIGISVKGVGTEMLKRLANVSDAQKVEKGIRRAIEFHKTGVGTVFSSLMTLDDLWQIATTTREWGANTFSISFASATLDTQGDPSSKNFMVSPDRISSFVEVFNRIDKLFEGNVSFEPQLPFCFFETEFIDELIRKGQLSNGCFINNRSGFTVDKDGNVFICNSIYHEPIAQIGHDFTDGESLITHLNSEPVKDIFRELLRYPSGVCLDCYHNKYCRGGCVINWTILSPNMLKPIRKEV